MKRILLLLTIATAVVMPSRAQYEYSRDVTRAGGTDVTPTIQVTVMADDKKELQEKAILSVLDTYIFYGIEGLDNGSPKADESVRDDHYEFFRRVYNNKNTYGMYVCNIRETVKPRRNDIGLQQAVYTMTLNKRSFDRVLENEGFIKKQPVVNKPLQILPSIMVVPYRKSGENYRDLLDNSAALRAAVSKVQDMFQENGYTTVDFIGKLEAAERDIQFAKDDADSFAAQLIRNSGADIYVVVDASYMKRNYDYRLDLYLKAYYTANGNIVASKDASANGNYGLASLCKAAIHRAGKEFMDTINEKFRGTSSARGSGQSGQSAKLVVTVNGESALTLDTEVGDDGFTLADYIRNYVKKNAKAHKMSGLAPELMTFDTIIIPETDKKGNTVDVTDFASALARFIKGKGVSCTYIIDGLTMRLTVSD